MIFKSKTSNRAFTLIELLVVIAIIGMLSAIVLASLATARNKAADASVKSQLTSIREQAELYYDSGVNSYGVNATSSVTAGNACGTTGMYTYGSVAAATLGASNNAGTRTNGIGSAVPGSQNIICGSTANYWQVAGILKTSTNGAQSWCVDSTGKSGIINTPNTTTFSC